MAVDQEILDLLEGRELSVKDLALELERSPAALYKPMGKLVQDGLVNKREKLVQGKWVAFYSVPADRAVEGCGWESHKEILLAGKTYRKDVLSNDFWPAFAEDIQTLDSREQNVHLAVVGLVGWGKSTTAIWISKQLDPSFAVQDIIFVKQDLLRLVASQPKNKTFVLDDVGVMLSSRQWQERERELIFSFLEICRMNRVNTIATAPSLEMIDLNYRRLLHYIFEIELRCEDHIHIIVFKPTTAGLKPSFKPVGTLVFPFPESVDHIVKQYQAIKQEQLSFSARASLERLEKAKEGVTRYVSNHPVTRITSDLVSAALDSVGLNGDLPKRDRDKLRVQMYKSLEEKKKAERKAKRQQVEQGKENLRKARLSASYRSKRQAYIDKGRSEAFSKTLAFRLTFEKSRAGNLKNLPGAMGSLLKNVKPYLVERLVLSRLDDTYLVRDLRGMRDILAFFKSFDQPFYSKVFRMFLEDPKLALSFISEVKEMRKSFFYRYHGKFSPKKWREAVLSRLRDLEAKERWKRQQDRHIEGIIAAGIDLGYTLFKKENPKLLEYVDQKDRSFWGDV
ncbi:hypothetical protein ES702_02017 [subsurface metagenome]